MRRRFAEYRPAPRWRTRLSDARLFRTVQLHLAGWAAVTALCLSGAVLGYVGSRFLRLPGKPAALGGALSVLGCLVLLDRRRHARLIGG